MKPHIDEKTAQTNHDLMSMLFSIDEVIEKCKQLRKKYKLPENGIREPEQNYSKWMQGFSGEQLESWLHDTEAIWRDCPALSHDKRYINHIRTFITHNNVTAPTHNFVVKHEYNAKFEPGSLSLVSYRRLSTSEKKLACLLLEDVRKVVLPETTKMHRPKKNIKRDNEIQKKMKSIGEIRADGTRYNTDSVVSEVFDDEAAELDGAKDKKRKAVVKKSDQRRKKEIDERLGWDNTFKK